MSSFPPVFLYSQHPCVCCGGCISPSQSLLYLEAKALSELTAGRLRFTPDRSTAFKPIFSSRLAHSSSPDPLSLQLASLTVFSFILSPVVPSLLLSSTAFKSCLTFVHSSTSQLCLLIYLCCLFCFVSVYTFISLVSFIQSQCSTSIFM